MPDTKISEDPPASALTGAELLAGVQSGENVNITPDQIGDRVLAYLRDTDTSLAANSDSKFATQKAVKAYADALIAANDAMVFKGVIDCSANPNYPAANRGDTYRVSVAGKIGGGSGPNVEVGDLLLCLTDSTSSGTHGSVGSNWSIAQTNLDGAVIGPSSATDGYIALFDGTSGKLIKVGTLSQVLDLVGSAAHGDILYRGSSAWARLPAGTSGQFLQTQGAGANPQWAAAASGTAGRHAIYIPAAAMRPSASGGCAAIACIASAANQPDITTLDFDASTQEYAQFSFEAPKSWNEGTITFVPLWSHAATTTNFGVVWDLQCVAVSDDDAIATSFGTAQTSTDTGGTTNDLYRGPESSAITVGGSPAAQDTIFCRLSRVTGNGSDTMAIDARLHGIVVFMTTDAETDA